MNENQESDQINELILHCEWLARRADPVTAYALLSGLLTQNLDALQEAKVRLALAEILLFFSYDLQTANQHLKETVQSLIKYRAHY